MNLFEWRRPVATILTIVGLFVMLCTLGCSSQSPAPIASAPPPTASAEPPPPPPPPPKTSAKPPETERPPLASAEPPQQQQQQQQERPPRGSETAAPRLPSSLPTFPWPPPKPSARVVVPTTAFNSARTFGNLMAVLDKALSDSGYSEKSYWEVPDGVAVVMRLERTYADGRPAAAAQRWVVSSSPLRPLSLSDYLRALFTADPGYYRVVAFVVTDASFVANGAPITESGARDLLANGAVSLPPEYLSKALPAGYNCTALVYEFFRETGKDASELDPGHLDGKSHLVASGIWGNLHLQ